MIDILKFFFVTLFLMSCVESNTKEQLERKVWFPTPCFKSISIESSNIIFKTEIVDSNFVQEGLNIRMEFESRKGGEHVYLYSETFEFSNSTRCYVQYANIDSVMIDKSVLHKIGTNDEFTLEGNKARLYGRENFIKLFRYLRGSDFGDFSVWIDLFNEDLNFFKDDGGKITGPKLLSFRLTNFSESECRSFMYGDSISFGR